MRSGVSKFKYGTEYYSVGQVDNVKFIKQREGSLRLPLETRSVNRIYFLLDNGGRLKKIGFYDCDGKQSVRIDVLGKSHKGVKTPHAHDAFYDDSGFVKFSDARYLSNKEKLIFKKYSLEGVSYGFIKKA